MDEDRLKDVGKRVSGSIKEVVGKVASDTRQRPKAPWEKTAGNAQNVVGHQGTSFTTNLKDD